MKKLNVSIIIIVTILMLGINSAYATNTSTTKNLTNELSETNEIGAEEAREERSNKELSTLEVEGYNLNPYFNKNTLTYTVIIPEDVTSLEINAEPAVDGAIVRISGNTRLTRQENTVTVRVTAKDGTSRAYTIIVLKEPKVNLKLESLQIEGVNLEPNFSSDTFYYTSALIDTELTSLNINAVANDPEANIEIVGSNNLVDGENLINIILSNDEETTIYQLNIDVDKLGEKEKEVDNVITRVRKIINYSLLGFAGLMLFIAFILIIVLIVKIVKRNKEKKMMGEKPHKQKKQKVKKEKTRKQPKH